MNVIAKKLNIVVINVNHNINIYMQNIVKKVMIMMKFQVKYIN